MEVQWYGHSCFRLADQSGFTVVTDPFDQSVGYPLPNLSADLVTLSHDHFDHNHYQGVKGSPKVANRPGTVAGLPRGVTARGVAGFHDEEQGRRRGSNTIFLIELDGIRVAHLGDLGHQLSADELAELIPVDVLLAPVGGTYTVDAQGAFAVCQAVQPKLVIPMHYKTEVSRVKVATVDPFLRLCSKVERPNVNRLTLTAEGLAGRSPWAAVVLNYR